MPYHRTICPCGCGLMSVNGCFVKGHRTVADRFWPKVEKTETCWLWTGGALSRTRTYGRLKVDGRNELAHHVAWSLAGGTIPEGMQILHVCDTPACVRNDDLGTYEVRGITYERRGHLFIGSIATNAADRAQKGRAPIVRPDGPGGFPGEQNPRAVLTEADVIEIRGSDTTIRGSIPKLARHYGVSATQIWNVVKRKSWPHI